MVLVRADSSSAWGRQRYKSMRKCGANTSGCCYLMSNLHDPSVLDGLVPGAAVSVPWDGFFGMDSDNSSATHSVATLFVKNILAQVA